MKCVITGGAGFIGSHLAARLARDGHEVTTIDRYYEPVRRDWWSKATRAVTCDLRDSTTHSDTRLRSLFKHADIVFHLAADMGGVGYFHSDADQGAARNNMRIDLNVLDAVGDTRLFYASSACALPHNVVNLSEKQLGGGPADQLYGEEKRMMSLLLGKQPNARVGIFHTIYGPGQEHDGPRAKFPPAICGKIKHAKQHGGKIEIWGDGTQMRTFLYIDDAVDRILKIATADTYDGPVNVGADEQVTVKQCADWLCAHAGIDTPEYEYRADKPTGVLARSTDNTGFYQRYGYAPARPAREGLAQLYDWLP